MGGAGPGPSPGASLPSHPPQMQRQLSPLEMQGMGMGRAGLGPRLDPGSSEADPAALQRAAALQQARAQHQLIAARVGAGFGDAGGAQGFGHSGSLPLHTPQHTQRSLASASLPVPRAGGPASAHSLAQHSHPPGMSTRTIIGGQGPGPSPKPGSTLQPSPQAPMQQPGPRASPQHHQVAPQQQQPAAQQQSQHPTQPRQSQHESVVQHITHFWKDALAIPAAKRAKHAALEKVAAARAQVRRRGFGSHRGVGGCRACLCGDASGQRPAAQSRLGSQAALPG